VKLTPLLDQSCSQADFAEMVGLSEARVSQLTADGVIPRGETGHNMLLAYCERLRDQAAGRIGSTVGGLDPAQEAAALKRSQREGQDIRNAVARGEFAPIGKLADVLGQASSAMADRFDQIEGVLRLKRPDIDDELMAAILSVVASARNEWIRVTARRVDAFVDKLLEEQDEEGALSDAFAPDDSDGLWEGSAA
jgi:phage terminase Nu1 subunit (DNA packaging protein)